MKSRPIQALELNLGSRFYCARVVLAGSGIGKADRIPAPQSSRLTLATKPYGPGAGCYEHAPRYTWAAMQEPVCGSRLRWGALPPSRRRRLPARRSTVPQSSVVGSIRDGL